MVWLLAVAAAWGQTSRPTAPQNKPDRMAASVAAGGTMLVVGHALANLADGHGGPQDPEVLYGPEDVADDLAGLEIERAELVRRAVSTADGQAAAIDVLVRGHRA